MPSSQQVIKCSEEVYNHVVEIDDWYTHAKNKKLSRFSLEWGEWSALMNRGIRQKIGNNHPDTLLLRYVFIYWINRSQLLELHYKTRFKMARKKQLARDGKRIKQIILSANAPDLGAEEMQEAIMRDIKGR